MRDFERLRDLSDTVASGLAAGDVVLAVDHALAGGTLDAEDRETLKTGEALLRQLLDPAAPVKGHARGGQQLMSPVTALDAAELVHAASTGQDFAKFVERLIAAIEHLVTHGKPDDDEALEIVLRVFSQLGDYELARVNTIVRTREEPMTWVSSMTTSSS